MECRHLSVIRGREIYTSGASNAIRSSSESVMVLNWLILAEWAEQLKTLNG